MSYHFVGGVRYVTEQCCNCGMAFAMTEDFRARRKKDKTTFYCPAGHAQHYVGKTEEQELREKLDEAHRRMAGIATRAYTAEAQRDGLKRSQLKLRERIRNGVCPCCNRSFGNLREHMKTQHPEYGTKETAAQLLDLFGLTKAQLAAEVGVSGPSVTKYFQGKAGTYVKARVDRWVDEQLEAK